MRLTLILPQLIWPEPEDKTALDQLVCPSLEWLLAHGTLSRCPAQPYETTLAEAFGLAADAPFGALRLLGERTGIEGFDPREGFWLCADPVHLRFHHERIILADAGAFHLSKEEALLLATALNQEFSDVGLFHVAEARRWYVQLKTDTPFTAHPLSAVAGRRIEGELPNEAHSSKLRSWLNEVQMFLHGHPVNSDRARAGHPAVNSLWLWGAGALPAAIESDYDGVWAGDPLALGHARAAGIPTHAQLPNLGGLLDHAAPGTSHLVVADHLLAPVLYEDPRGWRDAMARLEKDWFEPLRAALGKKVDAVTLRAPTVYGQLTWEVKAADRWKIWRRPQPLASLAKEFAQ